MHQHPRIALPALPAIDMQSLAATLATLEVGWVQALAFAAEGSLPHGSRGLLSARGRGDLRGRARSQEAREEPLLQGPTTAAAQRQHPFVGRRAGRTIDEQRLRAIFAGVAVDGVQPVAIRAQDSPRGLRGLLRPGRRRLGIPVTHHRARTRSPSSTPGSGRNCPTRRSAPAACAPGSCSRTWRGWRRADRRRW